MTKQQWIFIGIIFLLVIGTYAATQKQLFGERKRTVGTRPVGEGGAAAPMSTDSLLFYARKALRPDQVTRLNFLEHSISRGDVKDQQVHVYHQLASFWADTARQFAPYAFYTAEAARLENSEKNLTFAARLLLNNLIEEQNPQLKQWEALQAKDLFERSLKIAPANDSAKVGLGAVYLYSGIDMPMKGIGMIKEVADRDSTNVYAQMALGQASLTSGQLEKAAERFKTIVRLQPGNLEAIFNLAELSERTGKKEEAVSWYQKSLDFITIPAMKREVEARIAALKK
jgi:tetratricopeptide (TPR) repeat protein